MADNNGSWKLPCDKNYLISALTRARSEVTLITYGFKTPYLTLKEMVNSGQGSGS